MRYTPYKQSEIAASATFQQGAFMDPTKPSSLAVEDRSRFRPESFVTPREIQLMQGTFTLSGSSDIPTQKPPVRAAAGWYMSE